MPQANPFEFQGPSLPLPDSPTSVDLLYCVMVVADVFAQAAGGVKGLFTLPAWVPLQCLREEETIPQHQDPNVLGVSFFLDNMSRKEGTLKTLRLCYPPCPAHQEPAEVSHTEDPSHTGQEASKPSTALWHVVTLTRPWLFFMWDT